MLQLMRLGIVPFGTALLAVVSGDEPELNAVDLPALNPDMQALRKTVALYRPHLQQMLRTKFGIELLAVYAYPAQVIFCAKPFTGLSDLAGRRIRTSSVGQSEMMTALGAIPVLTPFAVTTPGVFLYYPDRRQVLPKLRAFIEHVKGLTEAAETARTRIKEKTRGTKRR